MTPTASVFHSNLDITFLRPSPTNPRKHFDPAKLAELASSLRENGMVQAITARQQKKGGLYEIVAGERRYRAAILAGLAVVPVLERHLTDEQVVEIQLVENIQRDDLTALEQARGYRSLMDSNPGKHTAASIATRVGMSEAWVWDRLKLNDLIPEAKELLEQERMAVGHAILIARQKPDSQKRIIGVNSEALFVPMQHGLSFDGVSDPKEKPGKYDDLRPVSVRELEGWIAHHIRFDIPHAAKAAPLQFGETAAKVEQAAALPGRGKKVVHITFSHGASDSAKDPHERTYGEMSWRRADGTKKTQLGGGWPRKLVDSPTCEYSVLGVVVTGEEHYGETFQVCVARDRCLVHWGQELKAREKNAKLRESGQTKKASGQEAAAIKRQEKADAARRANEARWKALLPALRKATFAAAGKVKTLSKPQLEQICKAHGLPPLTTVARLPMALLESALEDTFRYAWQSQEPKVVAWAKLMGVDVKAIERELAKKKAAA